MRHTRVYGTRDHLAKRAQQHRDACQPVELPVQAAWIHHGVRHLVLGCPPLRTDWRLQSVHEFKYSNNIREHTRPQYQLAKKYNKTMQRPPANSFGDWPKPASQHAWYQEARLFQRCKLARSRIKYVLGVKKWTIRHFVSNQRRLRLWNKERKHWKL